MSDKHAAQGETGAHDDHDDHHEELGFWRKYVF